VTIKTKILGIYLAVAVISTGVVATGIWLRSRLPKAEMPIVTDVGKSTADEWFPVTGDISLTNQSGERVRFSDLKGKVCLVLEFFAVCPRCAVRNGSDLRAIYDTYRKHPDFQVVCISVDPEEDTVERLKDYSAALGADPKNWWFLTGDREESHRFLRNSLKFLDVRERTNPVERDSLGRYAHDLGFLVMNRDGVIVGKRDLAYAAEQGAATHERYRAELDAMIRHALEKKEKGRTEP